MLPLSILTAQKVADLLNTGGALVNQVTSLAASANVSVPAINPLNIVLSSAAPDLGDRNMQLTYPRICLYSERVKNTQAEKFRAFSGTVAVIAEVWASGNLVQQGDQWIHFYVEALTSLLRNNIGDWSDGVFFSGVYDVLFAPPKAGGFGFVQSAKITCTLNVSRS